jgi:metal-sulfur cluster biosynthetic enzyme
MPRTEPGAPPGRAALPDESAVLDALRGVDDPEAGMNIVDLGLVYAVRSGASRIEVDMTMTTPACPVAETVVGEARAAIEAIAPVGTAVEVNLVWEPIWNPPMMSGTAREFFGWDK